MNRRFLALAMMGLSASLAACRQGNAPVAEMSGKDIYTSRCAVCHGVDRAGVSGFTAALTGSKWVDGSPTRFAAILLDGIQVQKGSATATMPAWSPTLTDTQIAAVMTWLRQQDNKPAIDAAAVGHARTVITGHNTFWTFQDLESVPGN
jgi:mono/diheme cytochrome c family protein